MEPHGTVGLRYSTPPWPGGGRGTALVEQRREQLPLDLPCVLVEGGGRDPERLRDRLRLAAAAIRERLFDRFAVTPEAMLAADPDALHDAGLSEAKVEYVRATARAFREREWDHDYFAGMSDDAVAAELTDIRGVGPWTAKMFLMFGLAREDVFPVEDLGVRKGMWTLFDEEMTRTEMRDRAAEWAPYRSYASRYLWRAVEG